MKHSVIRWIQDVALAEAGTTAPLKLTPGQGASLATELGLDQVHGVKIGERVVEVVHYRGVGIGDNVVLAPRLDLFSDAELGMVSRANAVTSVPDNVACVEIVDPGNASHLERGDLVFLDMFRTKQSNVLQTDMLYIAGGADFIARYDADKAEIKAIDNYVLTRPDAHRMTVAMNGTGAFEAPRSLLSDGFVSGLRHDGQPNARCVYQVVYDVGKLSARSAPDRMTRVEKRLLDMLAERNLEAMHLINALIFERREGLERDVKPGDLVSFCTDLGTRIRIRGEYHYAVPYKNLLMVVDDAAIERDSRRKGSALILTV